MRERKVEEFESKIETIEKPVMVCYECQSVFKDVESAYDHFVKSKIGHSSSFFGSSGHANFNVRVQFERKK